MKTIPADAPLTDQELERLEFFLEDLHKKYPDAMEAEAMDGFLCALACNPETVPPSEYLPLIFAEGMDDFASDKEAEEIMGLVFRHWNTICETLAKGEVHDRFFTEFDGQAPRGNQWSQGFMLGASFCQESWSAIAKDEELCGMVMPMMVLSCEHHKDPAMRPPPISVQEREKLITAISMALPVAYKHFEPERKRNAGRVFSSSNPLDNYRDDDGDRIPVPVVRDEPKIGRNEPCPCGSGRKYKRCHGSAAMQ